MKTLETRIEEKLAFAQEQLQYAKEEAKKYEDMKTSHQLLIDELKDLLCKKELG